MAEEEGKKDDFEFTAEGEALDYISLDQARLLAMQTARDAPGDYGRRFSQSPMAFVVTEATDTEDYYVVTLSFRPQGDFAGVSGREQFFIDKEGAVAHRQVLGLPRRRRFPLPAVVIGVLLAGAAVFVVTGVLTGRGFGGERTDDVGIAAVAPSDTGTRSKRTPRSREATGAPKVTAVPREAVVSSDTPTQHLQPTINTAPAVAAPVTATDTTATPRQTVPTSTPVQPPTPTFAPRPTRTPRPSNTPAPTATPAETTLQGRPVVAGSFDEFCANVKLEVESWDLPPQLTALPQTGNVVVRYRVPLGAQFEHLFFSVRTNVAARGSDILAKYPYASVDSGSNYAQSLNPVDRFQLTADGLWHIRVIPMKVPSAAQFMHTGKPGGVPAEFAWSDFVQPPYTVSPPPNFSANFRLGAQVIQVGNNTRCHETSR